MRRATAGRVFLAAMALAIAAVPGAQAAGSHAITVTATVLSKNICRFSAPTSTLALAIDPASGAAASGGTTLSIRCMGSGALAVWSLSNDSGLHGGGPTALRMRHATDPLEYLNYSLAYTNAGSVPKNTDLAIPLTATVTPASFVNALPGTYSDSVTLSLLP